MLLNCIHVPNTHVYIYCIYTMHIIIKHHIYFYITVTYNQVTKILFHIIFFFLFLWETSACLYLHVVIYEKLIHSSVKVNISPERTSWSNVDSSRAHGWDSWKGRSGSSNLDWNKRRTYRREDLSDSKAEPFLIPIYNGANHTTAIQRSALFHKGKWNFLDAPRGSKSSVFPASRKVNGLRESTSTVPNSVSDHRYRPCLFLLRRF